VGHPGSGLGMGQPVIRKLLLVAGLPLAIGVVVAVPVGLTCGSAQWDFAGMAFGLCVLPGLVVVALGEYFIRTSPYGRLLALVVGTFVRLMAAFGGGVVIFLLAGPSERADRIAFWLWVLFAYLATLVVETALMAGPLRQGMTRAEVVGGAGHGG